eukprot:TRINITY_DN1378_c0_g1_i3.p5 TRINITY_DN1378_c0_g1~~TRINITY_DN1378_c0_g1_i3.p5  ORF type:complete len:106 (+),score=30.85 TRINITY_DN1378_c0_g1_i3:1392-1709(+)
MQQLTGINTVCMYAPAIFEKQDNSDALSAAMAGIQVVFAALTPLFIDRYGRRTLFIWGMVFCSIGHLMACIGFTDDGDNTARNWVLNIGILLYSGVFNATYGALT